LIIILIKNNYKLSIVSHNVVVNNSNISLLSH